MKQRRERWLVAVGVVVAAGMSIVSAQNPPAGAGGGRQGGGAPPSFLKLTSSAFADGGMIPAKYGCGGQPVNTSPPLQWSDVPAGTLSFVLLMHDVDSHAAPGRLFDDGLHWLLWNIPATTTSLAEGVPASAELPDGTRQFLVAGRGATPGAGFRNPCPSFVHHYVIELFAVDVKTDLPAASTRADVSKAIDGHILGHATMIGLFTRP